MKQANTFKSLKSWFGTLIAIAAVAALQACSDPITCAEAKATLSMGGSPKSADEAADWAKACAEDCRQLVQVSEEKGEVVEEARKAVLELKFPTRRPSDAPGALLSRQLRYAGQLDRLSANLRAARQDYRQAADAVEATPGCGLPDL